MDDQSCLIIIDMQKGVFTLKQPIQKAAALIGIVQKAIQAARKKKMKLLYTQHENNGFLKSGTKEWEIVDELKPAGAEPVFRKKNQSVFKEPEVLHWLHQKNVRRVFIAGLISNGCIRDSCRDGLEKGFEVALISDAHSTFYKDAEKIIRNTNEELKRRGAALVTSREFEE